MRLRHRIFKEDLPEIIHSIVGFEMQGNYCYGKAERVNPKTVKVWWKGRLIERDRIKHNVKFNAPLMQISSYHGPVEEMAQKKKKTK